MDSKDLDGRTAIEPFLKLAMMAYTELRRTVKFEKQSKFNNINGKIVALIVFEKGERGLKVDLHLNLLTIN